MVNDLLNRHYSQGRPNLCASGSRALAADAPDRRPRRGGDQETDIVRGAENGRRGHRISGLASGKPRGRRGQDRRQSRGRGLGESRAHFGGSFAIPPDGCVCRFQHRCHLVSDELRWIYAFVFYHPYYLSIFFLLWVVAAIVAGGTWVGVKLLSD